MKHFNLRRRFLAIVCLLLLASQAAQGSDIRCASDHTPGIRSGIARLYADFLRPWICAECDKVRSSCDLFDSDRIPEVVLLGELHNDANSIAERERIFGLAKRGLLPVASEVGPKHALQTWERISPNIFGIESPIPYALATSYIIERNLIDNSEPPADLLREVAKNIEINPLFRKAYEDLRQASPKLCPGCFRGIDLVTGLGNADRDSPADSSPDWLGQVQFLGQLHHRIVQIVHEKYADRIRAADFPPIHKASEAEKLGIYKNGIKKGSKIQVLIDDIRNVDFTASVADLLCRLKGSSTHLFVVVGDAHVEGISKLLKGLSGNRVKVHQFKTWEPQDSEKLQALVRKVTFKPGN